MDILKNKCSYEEFDPVGEIRACVRLLGEIEVKFTPTDVLRVLGYTECNELRSLVVYISKKEGFVCKSSGKGIVIFNVPF